MTPNGWQQQVLLHNKIVIMCERLIVQSSHEELGSAMMNLGFTPLVGENYSRQLAQSPFQDETRAPAPLPEGFVN